jgi:endonuclease/exonuclease/phosphatase family metal-dependent hydrolase
MKHLFLFLFLIRFIPCSSQTPIASLNVATFNLRLDLKSDGINQWENRKQWVSQTVQFYEMEIIGMQEAFHHQLMYLLEQNPDFKKIGVGRDDGKQAGEYSPIIYNSTRFEVSQSNTFWLSETPDKPGLGWDAKYNRIVTWGKFHDKITNKDFFVFNTHFDHIAETARRESAKLVLKSIKEIAGNSPIILMGDFNAELSTKPMQILLDNSAEVKLKNTIDLSKTPHFGPLGTSNGFTNKEKNDEAIDHILVNKNFSVEKHATLSNTWQGRFASDHFAVFTKLLLNN